MHALAIFNPIGSVPGAGTAEVGASAITRVYSSISLYHEAILN